MAERVDEIDGGAATGRGEGLDCDGGESGGADGEVEGRRIRCLGLAGPPPGAGPDTAPIVKWIFVQRLAGHSVARIARALNDVEIPCPSAADPERNAHRSGREWTQTTVRSILANPRYTGRQVWNRQPTAHDLIDPASIGLGYRKVQRWNLPDGWVISARLAHLALVSEADFVAVQNIRAPHGSPDPARCYRSAGLLRCGICRRRMESCWSSTPKQTPMGRRSSTSARTASWSTSQRCTSEARGSRPAA
ncbi:recombinase family protein [Actinoallomurus acanthiterrae]